MAPAELVATSFFVCVYLRFPFLSLVCRDISNQSAWSCLDQTCLAFGQCVQRIIIYESSSHFRAELFLHITSSHFCTLVPLLEDMADLNWCDFKGKGSAQLSATEK